MRGSTFWDPPRALGSCPLFHGLLRYPPFYTTSIQRQGPKMAYSSLISTLFWHGDGIVGASTKPVIFSMCVSGCCRRWIHVWDHLPHPWEGLGRDCCRRVPLPPALPKGLGDLNARKAAENIPICSLLLTCTSAKKLYAHRYSHTCMAVVLKWLYYGSVYSG